MTKISRDPETGPKGRIWKEKEENKYVRKVPQKEDDQIKQGQIINNLVHKNPKSPKTLKKLKNLVSVA